MAKVSTTWEFGDVEDMEELLRELQQMYSALAVACNSKPDIYQRTVADVPTDGNAGDTFLSQGDININTTTNKVEMITNHGASSVTWTTLS